MGQNSKAAATNKVALNASFVEGVAHPTTGKVVYWDANTPNFGLRVTPTEKTFFIRVKVNGESKERSLHPASALKAMTIAQIRNEATQKVIDLKRGVDFVEVQKEEAERKRQDRLSSLTMSEALEEYLKANPQLSERTASDYRNLMGGELASYATGPLRDITRDKAEEMMRDIVSRLKKGRGSSGARANYALRLVRVLCLNFEQGNQKWGKSGTKKAFPWVKTKAKRTELDPEMGHGAAIWKALSSRRCDTAADYIKAILLTGARRGEMAAVKVGDVSIKNRTMRLVDTKNHEDHVIYMADQLVEIVERQMTDRRTGEKKGAEEPLFSNCSEPKKILASVSEEIEVTFTCHSLRKFFSITCMQLGVPYPVIKACLNHKATDVTSEHYAHATASMMRKAWQQVADYNAPRDAISLNAHREAA